MSLLLSRLQAETAVHEARLQFELSALDYIASLNEIEARRRVTVVDRVHEAAQASCASLPPSLSRSFASCLF
jgi:hypothetical protein